MTATDNAAGFRLTGWHVLAILIGFFAVIFAVNGYMAYVAIGSFPGAATASSYSASQRYNVEIAAADAQTARGWQVEEHIERGADGRAVLTLTVRDKDGTPVDALAVAAKLHHPVKQGEDVTGTVDAAGAGRYVARFDGVEAGLWTLAIDGTRGGDRLWRSENRVVLR